MRISVTWLQRCSILSSMNIFVISLISALCLKVEPLFFCVSIEMPLNFFHWDQGRILGPGVEGEGLSL